MLNSQSTARIINTINQTAKPCTQFSDLEPLIEKIGNADIVMLGEASHGTHEYYTWRAQITKRLITEKGFRFIAVEGDWPDCYKINRYIKGYQTNALGAYDLLHHFSRWPSWMWANLETTELAEWLKQYNEHLLTSDKVGFYGLDVYSLWESLEAIMAYLQHHDPQTLQLAQKVFDCFMPYRKSDGQDYAVASRLIPVLCENDVIDLLQQIRAKVPKYNSDPENVFSTEQNAIIAVNAEKYYRAMIRGGSHSWNIRDYHMQDTLDRLLHFHQPAAKAIVWAHNTHIGDARATDMTANGMINLGELSRKHYGHEKVALVGFGSYKGSVIAGDAWGETMQKMKVPEAMPGSWEHYLHLSGSGNKLLFSDDLKTDPDFEKPLGHRAIGVVYHPQRERFGNFVPSIIPKRYDAFIYLENTSALYPLHNTIDTGQLPETYPSGM